MIKFPQDISLIAVAGDWHANTRYAEKALRYAGSRGVQAVLHTGDFGYNFAPGYLDLLDQTAEKHDLILMFVDGNHENFDWLLSQPISDDGVRRLRERVWHLPRNFRWTWMSVSFLALGGAHSVDRARRTPGVSWWPQETLTFHEAARAIAYGRADVMITHDCPTGVEIPGLGPDHYWPAEDITSANQHRDLLGDVVNAVRPRHLFHGHYHVHYQTERGPTTVHGLALDGTPFDQNMEIYDIIDLAGHSRSTRRLSRW